MGSALKRFYRARPGIKFFLIGAALSGLGIAVVGVSKPLGAVLLVIGVVLMIGFKSHSDLRRGWPPWPLSEFPRSVSARKAAFDERDAPDTVASPQRPRALERPPQGSRGRARGS